MQDFQIKGTQYVCSQLINLPKERIKLFVTILDHKKDAI